MQKISVLNGQGYVTLVNSMGNDKAILDAARVSYDKDSIGHGIEAPFMTDKDEKLLRYLLTNKHTSPFEHVQLSFEVSAPIFVFRQWHRHRTWCLAKGTPLDFSMPGDGKVTRQRIEDIVRRVNAPEPKRKRNDLTLSEFNRKRLANRLLRGPYGYTSVTDAWFSGEKRVYRVRTKYGEVTASENHVFMTPNGPARVCDGLPYVMAHVPFGDARPQEPPTFTASELATERWYEFLDGHEVSNLGRVRSWWLHGAHAKKRVTPVFRKLTLSKNRRVVVSAGGDVHQVSQLVARAFLGLPPSLWVLHRNDNALDNRAVNLYVGTAADNARDQYVNGGRVKLRTVPAKVLDIVDVGCSETFDLTVTGDHWFVANNLVVHNSYNEISARYTELPNHFYVPAVEDIGVQHTSNKQMRESVALDEAKEIERRVEIAEYYARCSESFQQYNKLILAGWPRELARMVLPVSTFSRMVATVDLHNLMGFLRLRLHEHAQKEIREYAVAMLSLMSIVAPLTTIIFRQSLYGQKGYEWLTPSTSTENLS